MKSLERIHLEDKTVEEKVGSVSLDYLLEKDYVHEFVKKVLKASRPLDEFSHGDHNNDQLLLALDYTDKILHRITVKASSSSGLSREEDS